MSTTRRFFYASAIVGNARKSSGVLCGRKIRLVVRATTGIVFGNVIMSTEKPSTIVSVIWLASNKGMADVLRHSRLWTLTKIFAMPDGSVCVIPSLGDAE